MNLPSLNQMTSKVPKCVRPRGLILNEGLLTDRKCLHVTFQVTDGQTRSAHHRLGDNTLFTNLFSNLSSNSPRRQVLIIPILLLRKLKPGWGRWFCHTRRSWKSQKPWHWSRVPVRAAGPEDTSQAEGHPGLPWVSRVQSCNAHPLSSWMVHPDSGFESTKEFSWTPL